MGTAVYILLLSSWALGQTGTPTAPIHQTAAPSATASRVVLRVGEQRQLEQPQLEAVVVVDERVARVTSSQDTFTVIGQRPGETIAQVIAPGRVHVFVVVVEPPPPPPESPAALQPVLATQPPGRLTSLFGANSATTTLNVTPWGTTLTETLHFAGRVQEGTYNADIQASGGTFGAQLLRSRLAWRNDRRNRAFELGDTAATVAGSRNVPGLGVLGLRVEAGDQTSKRELVIGTARRFGTPRLEPVVSAGLSGETAFRALENWTLRYRTTATGFGTEEYFGAPGRVGLLAGAELGFLHPKSGYGVELRTVTQATNPRSGGGPARASGELGAAVYQLTDSESYRLEYQGNLGHLYSPTAGAELPARQQVGASMGRRFTDVFSGTASWHHHWLWSDAGDRFTGSSFGLGVRADLSKQTQLSLTGGSSSAHHPIYSNGSAVQILELQQWYAQLLGTHRLGTATMLQGVARHDRRFSSVGNHGISTLSFGATHAPSTRWQAGGAASVSVVEESFVAVDRPPMSFELGFIGDGRVVLARGLDARAGIQIQQPINAMRPTQVGATVGVHFMPTTIHLLTASVTARSPLAGGTWNTSVMATYTYHFGADVHERPVFEFLARGGVEGIVCVDADADGRCGPAEPPVPNVLVRLSNGQVAQTDLEGRYAFEGLRPGFYSVEVDERPLREIGRMTTSSINSFNLVAAGQHHAVFAVTRSCRIEGSVYDDLDMDARRGAADPLFPGVRVAATGPGGATASAQAGNLGSFRLDLPECGDWTVTLEPGSLPASMTLVRGEAKVTAAPGMNPSVELLVGALRTIQGTVFIDENRNGVRDPNERAVTQGRVRWSRGEAPISPSGTFLLRRLPAGTLELSLAPDSLPDGLVPGAPVKVDLGRAPVILDNVHLPAVP